MSTLKMIVCLDSEYGIGDGTSMSWNIPTEMQLFKNRTTGGIVVMGRTTYESIGAMPLPDRVNVVMSRNPKYTPHHAPDLVVNDVNAVLDMAKDSDKDIWIIGGREIYNAFYEHVDEMHITLLKNSYNCIIKMPELERVEHGPEWKQVLLQMDGEWTNYIYERVEKDYYLEPQNHHLLSSSYEAQMQLNVLNNMDEARVAMMVLGMSHTIHGPEFYLAGTSRIEDLTRLLIVKAPYTVEVLLRFLMLSYYDAYLKGNRNESSLVGGALEVPYQVPPLSLVRRAIQAVIDIVNNSEISDQVEIESILAITIPLGSPRDSLNLNLGST